ncbi:UNVERIFIED_CONTAM: hypothetical protein PYX00_001605 [Menopon gallinae]|uniref:phosphatidylinositol-3,4-bisphosphate 4-phosphatase n=1 Tax=Menopon gallinae TaxID=328185 RepID=A0AAW2IE43_9NEOP
MRFNKQELMTLANQPSHKFDKEGVLYLRERQDGFFRRNELNLERWCRLRGNLLFYFKSRDQWSEPLGVIVLEQCTVKVDPVASPLPDAPFGFYLVFEGGNSQYLAAPSEQERSSWLDVIQTASYDCMRSRLQSLQEKLELRKGQDPHLDIFMWRLQRGHCIDPSEVPICEVSISCDNLLCDGHGRPPNPVVVVHVFLPAENVWIKYAKTEVIARSSNPCFLSTVSFRHSDGLTPETRVRLTALDVRERVSHTSAPLGQAVITLSSIQESQKLRIPLRSSAGTTVGFLTMVVWNLEVEGKGSTESTPSRAVPVPAVATMALGHRRSQSLPPRLNTKMKLPHQGPLNILFANPVLQTYRFHSGLGGDICVQEIMAESKMCFLFPQQLLAVWIQEEKELLQEVSGMGELREPWHSRQVELLDRHLQLLHLYSQAKEHLQAHKGGFFKPSARKHDRTLEFAPVNLHLQRMWAQNDSLKKCGFYDVITVGAFTAHSHKSKNGGLIKLLQSLKESPTKGSLTPGSTKTMMAHDAIQAIKQLRREVVDGMKALMRLAREKQTNGMLPICDEMINKTRTLLSIWDSGLVEEALTFVEENKVINVVEDGFNLLDESLYPQTMSPYRRITQQLKLEFKSQELDDLVTPDSPCNQWPEQEPTELHNDIPSKIPTFNYANQLESLNVKSPTESERQFVIFPDCDDEAKENKCEEVNHSPVSNQEEHKSEHLKNGDDVNKQFLDTQVMCSSPSANYYKPTDEPEPWDLTQLNIEASVMCLVSKVKFLCGRCNSPAVRLRTQRGCGKQTFLNSQLTNGDENGIVAVQPANMNASNNGSLVIEPVSGNTPNSRGEVLNKAVDSVSRTVNGALSVKNGQTIRNKFTEGLDFDSIKDWTCELRPSMKKLRQAMDGLLKTARLTHSVFRVQEDRRTAQRFCNVRYRRDVCFSQALTSLVTGLMTKLWCQKPDPAFLLILCSLGPLASFESLLSYHGDEIDMWGDMTVAVEDLATVKFVLTRHVNKSRVPDEFPMPRVVGTRAALTVLLPVPDSVHSMIPLTYNQSSAVTFNVTPVFFNVGINEKATLADSLGNSKPQDKSNVDNFERLNLYYHRFKKLGIHHETRIGPGTTLSEMIENLRTTVHTKQSKNVQILHLSARICRKLKGLRFTSCKSAKDRTGMSVTLEQANILVSEYDLAEHEFQSALDCMRSKGCRRENTVKNTGVRKYAINSLQNMALPRLYRPPTGTHGSNAT